MSVNDLTNEELAQAMKQAIKNPQFKIKNSYFGSWATADIVRSIVDNEELPDVPLFSPYAPTKLGGYSQIRFEGDQIKYSMHRVASAWMYGSFSDGEDCSHRVYIGASTARCV
jgi:hypothetical protein